MATLQELEQALIKADAAGNTADAKVLADEIRRIQSQSADTLGEDVLDVAGELAAGANRALMWIPDTAVKAVNLIPGVEIPTPSEAVGMATGFTPGQGGYMDPGLAREAVGAAGEVFIPGGMAMKGVQARNLANIPEAAAEFVGFGQAAPVTAAARAPVEALEQVVSPPPVSTAPISEPVQQGMAAARRTPDISMARSTVDDAGRIIPSPKADEAIKQGLDEGIAAMINVSSKEDKKAFLDMLKIKQRMGRDKLFASRNRPWDVLGDSITNRIINIAEANEQAGKDLNAIVRSLGNRQADKIAEGMLEANRGFIDGLQGFGVRIVRDPETGERSLNFVNSIFNELPAAQRDLNAAFRNLLANPPNTAQRAHNFKKFLDELVYVGSTNKEGVSRRVSEFLKGYRRSIDQVLDNTFPAYDEANTIYSNTIEALDAFSDAAGKRIDPSNPRATGQIGRRILSNAVSREQLNEALELVESVANRFGGEFSDNIWARAEFASELDRLFGSSAPTSLAGEMEKTVGAAGKFGQEIARGQRAGDTVAGLAIEAAAKGAEKLRGINEQNAYRAIEELLRQ